MIYRALAASVDDPAERGRIKVMIPSITGEAISEWVWPVVTSGFWVLPEPGEQVWVLFENGDQDEAVWIGQTKEDEDNLRDRVDELEERVAALEALLEDG